jgi:hypothetical protein
VDVVAAVGTDEEAAAVVEPGEGSFDDPAATSLTTDADGVRAQEAGPFVYTGRGAGGQPHRLCPCLPYLGTGLQSVV